MTTQLVTVEEAAERLRVGRTTAFGLIRSGQLRSVRIGSSRRVPVAAIDEFVETLAQQATARG